MKQHLIGEDPLNVDKLYTKVLMRNIGAGAIAGITVTAASGIEIALWDLVGRILETPVCNLLGGRFRDHVRFYRTMQNPTNVNDPASWKELVQRARAEPFGWTAFKFQGDGVPENPKAMARVTQSVNIPICTGEKLYTRHQFRELIELQACDVVHIDIPKSGGLLESKRISDLADPYYIWTAAHNPASPIGTIASAHAAASMRTFRVHELAKCIDWWQDLVIHDGPIFKNGYLTIQDKPGYGVELNPDVARAHLAPGESWWG